MKTQKSKLKIIKLCTLFLLFAFCSLVLTNNFTYAAKKRIKGKLPATIGYSSAKLRSDRKAIFVNFFNLGNVKQIQYSLNYNANGVSQGAGGTLALNGEPNIQRELLFATCSKGICTYHYNISGMTLIVTTTTNNAVTSTKTYRIKP